MIYFPPPSLIGAEQMLINLINRYELQRKSISLGAIKKAEKKMKKTIFTTLFLVVAVLVAIAQGTAEIKF